MSDVRPLVIIPTWNEAGHIEAILREIVRDYPQVDVLVVDASSEDGTGSIVERLAKDFRQIHIIYQKEPGKFGEALRMGFKYALEHDYDPVITMDGDQSHSPCYIKDFLQASHKYDLVIGSRYIDGVRVEGWRFRKLLVSKLANMFVSYILVKPVWDFTSGFRCYRRRFLEKINIDEIYNEAYIAQIQLLHLAYQLHFRVKEIPFIYRGTPLAFSKVSQHTRRKTLRYVFKFRAPWWEIFRHLVYLKREYERFVDEYDEFVNPPELKNEGRFEVKDFYEISVGVMAYNEEKNIAKCLNALQRQKLKSGQIKEILVVSSGSTDRTDAIVQQFAQKDARIRLIRQARRMGKASAINEFLKRASGDIVVLESADTIAHEHTVEELIKPFRYPEVGMVGAHPVPVNKKNSFVGFCVHKLWELHHHMALQSPKCGEMVAFRNIVTRIPRYTAVDEAAIEAIISKAGLKLAYASRALVTNKGPETFGDFFKQRRRIASGHRHLKALIGYEVTTLKTSKILKLVWQLQRWTPRETLFMFLLILVEAFARFMGLLDFYIRDKNPFIWDISVTTKDVYILDE
ncbi:glycosyltransferase family 2 protein [Calditrichota bacterium LG25]